MSALPTPVLEPRDAEALAAGLRARAPAYVPGWEPAARGPGAALLEIYARYLRALAEAVNGAPDKHKLAFLDLLGVSLLPTEPARAPVSFTPLPGGGGTVSAGARVGAEVPGEPDPLVFETERAVALASAPLVEVVTVWPGRDAYADHTADATGGRAFALFEGLNPVRHELYVSHDLHLALTGKASVELELELASRSADPLAVTWEYWDGEAWRPFSAPDDEDKPETSFDGTRGLTRSGVLRLVAECAETASRRVGGHDGVWIRGRIAEPLPPRGTKTLPAVERIRLAASLDKSLPSSGCTTGLVPEAAFADGARLDLTKKTHPLGEQPRLGSIFLLSCEEAFSRPGAKVELCFERPQTPQEKADEEADEYAVSVGAAQAKVVAAAKAGAQAVVAVASAVIALADANATGVSALTQARDQLQSQQAGLTDIGGIAGLRDRANQVAAAITPVLVGLAIDRNVTVGDDPATRARIQEARAHASSAAAWANTFQDDLGDLLTLATTLLGGPLVRAAFQEQRSRWSAQSVLESGRSIVRFGPAPDDPNVMTPLKEAVKELADSLAGGFNFQLFNDAAEKVVNRIATAPADIVTKLEDVPNAAQTQTRLTTSRGSSATAATAGGTLLDWLSKLSAPEAAAVSGTQAPTVPGPRLVWEWWDGFAWRTLVPAAAPTSDKPRNLLGSGRISFTVPEGWERSVVNGVEGRWLRARLQEGSYDRLRLVSWTDQQSNTVNFLPILEPRPPVLDKLFLGYRWTPARVAPERCLTFNDWQWQDWTEEARVRGSAFEPFVPVRDRTPTLYLGFDGRLPAAELGLFLAVEEVAGETAGPPLEWEGWDGERWVRLSGDDETGNLALPGIVRVLWPGTPELPSASAVSAQDRTIQLVDAREAAPFVPGERLYVQEPGKDGEIVTLARAVRDRLELATALDGQYRTAVVSRAALARFGTPRSWIRARRRSDGAPRRARLHGIHPNSTWAAHVSTLTDEVIGSSDGSPRQAHFFRRTPVLGGEVVEVRELEGARADVEYALLVEDARANGIPESDLRTERDTRTGRIRAVWVRWRERPNLFASDAGDRHYVLERSRGRLVFGDGVRGRVPPAGSDNIRARRYAVGGGRGGNVSAGAISQVLGGAVVQRVANPRQAEGGADGEPLAGVLTRGPLTLRHRRQAVTGVDYEALAREASPAVALAHALPGTNASGLPAPGHVLLVVAPFSPEERPQPTVELRRRVAQFVRRRAPAGVALAVTGPSYLGIGVDATLVPRDPAAAPDVLARGREAATGFLHPLTGGPGEGGWPFGRDVYLSDIAAALEAVPGLDHVEALTMTVDGVAVGLSADVPPDRIAAPGPIRLALAGEEA